ncbi:hypothetical protein [Streptomyces mirabilis]|uniref:hypothetical protein n=1 Tax=Streptomyces mirabilis TaxID=68239 RepID=UPI00368EC30C
MPLHLGPVSEKLLREIAQHDTGEAVLFQHAARGRYTLPATGSVFNRATFFPLIGNALADDGGSDHTPVRITAAGRQHLAELNAATTSQHQQPTAENAARPACHAAAGSTRA